MFGILICNLTCNSCWFQQQFYIILEVAIVNGWRVPFVGIAPSIDQKLGEIVFDCVGDEATFYLLEPGKHWIRVWT